MYIILADAMDIKRGDKKYILTSPNFNWLILTNNWKNRICLQIAITYDIISLIPGRLPRKTIAKDALAGLNNDDIDEDILEKPRSTENSPASLKRQNINIRSSQPDLHGVITLPEPGESSTDHNDEVDGSNDPNQADSGSENESDISDNVTATIEEAGQKLGKGNLFLN